jgi:hypothetical protein
MEALEIGARVERVKSPPESLVKDGAVGTVLQVYAADNGELGYWVRFDERAGSSVFCAGTRLRAVAEIRTSGL